MFYCSVDIPRELQKQCYMVLRRRLSDIRADEWYLFVCLCSVRWKGWDREDTEVDLVGLLLCRSRDTAAFAPLDYTSCYGIVLLLLLQGLLEDSFAP